VALVGTKHVVDILALTKNTESAIARSSSVDDNLPRGFDYVIELSLSNFPRNLFRPSSTLNRCSVASSWLKASETNLDITYNDCLFEGWILRKFQALIVRLINELNLGRGCAVAVLDESNCVSFIAVDRRSRQKIVRFPNCLRLYRFSQQIISQSNYCKISAIPSISPFVVHDYFVQIFGFRTPSISISMLSPCSGLRGRGGTWRICRFLSGWSRSDGWLKGNSWNDRVSRLCRNGRMT
jgi:hypothetical protein